MSNYQPVMQCPQHKGQSSVVLQRRLTDLRYNSVGDLILEPLDEYWDHQGKLHLHYIYICSEGKHEFIMPCEHCAWGKEIGNGAVPPPPLTVTVILPPPPPPPPPFPAGNGARF